MKFCWSTLRVNDLEQSIQFYKEIVGLEVVNRFSGGPHTEIAFLGNGETQVELICDGDSRDINVGSDISWGFTTESLDKSLDMVRQKGINIESGPIQPNPHVKFFFIKDPDGMLIQLVENIA
ncbi:MAG: VOC family protein [Aminipila sp.]